MRRHRLTVVGLPAVALALVIASELWPEVTAIYDAFLAGDRKAIDERVAPDATLWDAFHEPLARYGDERPVGGGERPTDLRPTDPVIDVFGDVALVRHLLSVAYESRPEQRIRNTSVWRRIDGRWLCVHNHEDLVA